ncbi:MAG: hypothetical protein AAGG81_03520 [Chlamydiota bacterium]
MMKIEHSNGSFQQDPKTYSESTSEKHMKEITKLKAEIEASERPSVEKIQKLQQKMNELSLHLEKESQLHRYIQEVGNELKEQSQQQRMQEYARMLGGV